MELFLIDAIGPFFRDYPMTRVNWSKIPFDHLALEGEARQKQWEQIRADMRTFAQRVSAIGYNAVSLDDLVHLADHAIYEPEIRAKISIFQEEYRELFRIFQEYELKIFLTQDVMSYTQTLREHLGNQPGPDDRFSDGAHRPLL